MMNLQAPLPSVGNPLPERSPTGPSPAAKAKFGKGISIPFTSKRLFPIQCQAREKAEIPQSPTMRNVRFGSAGKPE